MFASQEVGVSIKYDRQLVQSLFLHCIETGLQDDIVRAKMRPLLTKPSVSDEELIKELNIAAPAEAKRKMKFMSGEKKTRINTKL